jgi:hypothetical protein
MADIYVATQSAMLVVDGKRHFIHKDRTRVREGHPLLTRNPGMFKILDVDYDVEPAVEQATAAPGEKRSVSTRRARSSDRTTDGNAD